MDMNMNAVAYAALKPAQLQQQIDSLQKRMFDGVFQLLTREHQQRIYSRLGALLTLQKTWNEEWQRSAAEVAAATDDLRERMK